MCLLLESPFPLSFYPLFIMVIFNAIVCVTFVQNEVCWWFESKVDSRIEVFYSGHPIWLVFRVA